MILLFGHPLFVKIKIKMMIMMGGLETDYFTFNINHILLIIIILCFFTFNIKLIKLKGNFKLLILIFSLFYIKYLN